MSELDPQYVKRGFWINEEQGSVMGRTITTDTRTGTIVIVLLTLLSTLGMQNGYYNSFSDPKQLLRTFGTS
jgi:hypothetical protein